MELNREQIIKALEEELKYVLWLQHGLERQDEESPDLDKNIAMLHGALSLIKELTQTNEMLGESYDHLEKTKDELIAERAKLTDENERLVKENGRVHQSYYEIACEVEDLRAIAEQYQKQFEDCYEEKAKLTKEKNNLEYTLEGVMLSVDKWLDGAELEQDEVNRAITMREKTLRIAEKLTEENERLQKNNAVLIEDNHILSSECIPIVKEMMEGG